MRKTIENLAQEFLEISKDKKTLVVSHYDSDGITSAAIMAQALRRLDRKFTIKILKQLDPEAISSLPEGDITIFLDLGSSHLALLDKFKEVFVIDHHELLENTHLKNIRVINPHLFGEEAISASGLTYLFVKNLAPENLELANLAVIGMVGDRHEKNIGRLYNTILTDAEVIIKKGLLFYPSTRPVHKTLEFSSSLFIPGVTGNPKGVLEILRECGIERVNGEYPSLLELDEEASSKLITSVLLKRSKKDNSDLIGNIYLIKIQNRLEDAREISAMLNACSRLGFPEIALLLCLGNKSAKQQAENIYASYKQHIVSALNFVANSKKIEGKGYVIINAKDNIKDTIIGTIASILSSSPVYEEGTIIIGMAYSEDKIKISARIAGREGRNVHEVLSLVTEKIGGVCGGHPLAAGATISIEQEQIFLDSLTKELEIELVKI